jgi:ABC-type multidrug transport system fused ATPase/permease subunit
VYTERQRTENQVVNETLHNWHTVFYFNRAPYEQDRYGTAIWNTIAAHYKYYFGSIGGHAFQDILMNLGFAGCCAFAMSQIIYDGKPVGSLVTFIMYWGTLMNPLYMMAYSWRTFSNKLVDAERLLQLLNTKPSVNDAPNAREIKVDSGRVEFKGVDFHYDPMQKIIKNASLIAEGGQPIAFVGETGGGKSTMLKLLSRAYDVTGGSISIDGQDLRSVTRSSLREVMGLVPQDLELFNTSIRENIRYGKLGASNAEIEDACRAAAIHGAITEFPDGYNSKVGERGVKLSGGQLQRIAIARVLLRNPKIVLLDEATSAVDSSIEALIQEAFRKLSKGRTTFVIAHRLSTIAEADLICVVKKGEIIERGTHLELINREGKYAELWTKQTARTLSATGQKDA